MDFNLGRPFHIAIKGCFIVGPELCSPGIDDQKYAIVGQPGDRRDAATFTLRDGYLVRDNEWAMGRDMGGPPIMMPKPAVWVRNFGSLHRMSAAPGPHGMGLVSEGMLNTLQDASRDSPF